MILLYCKCYTKIRASNNVLNTSKYCSLNVLLKVEIYLFPGIVSSDEGQWHEFVPRTNVRTNFVLYCTYTTIVIVVHSTYIRTVLYTVQYKPKPMPVPFKLLYCTVHLHVYRQGYYSTVHWYSSLLQ